LQKDAKNEVDHGGGPDLFGHKFLDGKTFVGMVYMVCDSGSVG